MNRKQVFAALAIAFAGNAAMAFEATEFEVPASTLTRAEVKAELAQAQRDGTLLSGGEATVFVDRPVASVRSRDDVRAEARAFVRSGEFNSLYVG